MHRAVSDPPCLLCINYLGRETPFPPSGVLACLESLCPGRGSGCNAQEMFFQIPFVAPDPLHHSAWCLLTASCVRAGNAASAEQGSRWLWSGLLGGPLAQPRLEVPVGLAPAQHRAGAKFSVTPERLGCVFFSCWKSLRNQSSPQISKLHSVKSAARALQGVSATLATQSEAWFNLTGCSTVSGKLLGCCSGTLLPLLMHYTALAVHKS